MQFGQKKILFFSMASVIVVLLLFPLDIAIWKFFLIPQYDEPLSWFTNWGLFVFYILFGILLIYALVKKDLKIKAVCGAYIKAQLLFSFALVRVMKIGFGRARPEHGPGFTFFSLDADYNSFPSGHSADAFAAGVCLYFLLKHSNYSVFRFVPLLYAALMALSRIMVSAHFPSDAVAGMAIGTVGAWVFLSKIPLDESDS